MSEIIDHIPPQNIEAEQAVLGAIILDQNNEALLRSLEILSEDDFYRESHRRLYRIMRDLFEKNEPVDIVTIADYLRKNGDLEMIGGVAYLSTLADSVPTSANIRHHARIVKEKALLWELLKGTMKAQEAIYADEDPQGIIANLQSLISNEKNFAGSSLITAFEMSSKLSAAIEKRAKNIDAFTGIATGFQGLDKVMDGLVGGNVILVGGRPGMGKTAFSLNIAKHVAQILPVGLISLEMSDQENGMRMLASETGEKLWKFRKGYIYDGEWSMVNRGIAALSNLQLFFADRSVRTLRAVESTIYNMAISKKCQLIIVDYLGLINVEGKNLNREREISMISDTLKSLAMRFDIPIIALSQLNRSLEQRQDKRPTLADLRDSGSLEQDADIVLFLYRDDYYNENSQTPGIVEVNIAKGRNIGTGIVKLRWDGQTQTFSDL